MTQTQRIQTETEKALALLSAATDLINSGRLVSIASLNGMMTRSAGWHGKKNMPTAFI